MAKWVCTVCGYEYEGETAPEECPVCGVGAESFEKKEDDAPKSKYAGTQTEKNLLRPLPESRRRATSTFIFRR